MAALRCAATRRAAHASALCLRRRAAAPSGLGGHRASSAAAPAALALALQRSAPLPSRERWAALHALCPPAPRRPTLPPEALEPVPPEILTPLLEQTLAELPSYGGADVAAAAGGLAALRAQSAEECEQAWARLEEHAVGLASAQAIEPADAAATLLAFSRAHKPLPRLCHALAFALQPRLAELSADGLCDVALAYAISFSRFPDEMADFASRGVRLPRRPLAALARDALLPRLTAASNFHLVHAAFAFVLLRLVNPLVFDAVSAVASARLGSFTPTELMRLVALCTMPMHVNSPFAQLVFDEVQHRLADFPPVEMVRAVHGLVHARRDEEHLFLKAAALLRPHLRELEPMYLSKLAWSLAKASITPPGLFEELAESLAPGLDELTAYHLTLVAWSFAVVDLPSKALFFAREGEDSAFVRCLSAHPLNAFDNASSLRLYQWMAWREEIRAREASERKGTHDGEGGILAMTPLPFELQHICSEYLKTAQSEPQRAHKAQQHFTRFVCKHLSHCLTNVQPEVRTDLGYSLDLVVTASDGKPVAIEFDGPYHYVGFSKRLNGNTLLKQRQIRAAGWRLLSIPYWEWTRQDLPPEDRLRYRQEYLLRRLNLIVHGADPMI
ncbi:hypothetical protein AB1Y20_001897 [Prymnesium parvum]|uniref:RAP domain-containing protein n=1 Tax=Prymnesium parvum TaxID=97485 RepID=A0AB34J9Y5_PRYPA